LLFFRPKPVGDGAVGSELLGKRHIALSTPELTEEDILATLQWAYGLKDNFAVPHAELNRSWTKTFPAGCWKQFLIFSLVPFT
jgi:hypothetical protein